MVTIINAGPGPVVYDEAGRSLGGGERRELAKLDAVGQRAVELGQLLTGEAPQDDLPRSEPAPDSKDDSAGRSARRTGKT